MMNSNIKTIILSSLTTLVVVSAFFMLYQSQASGQTEESQLSNEHFQQAATNASLTTFHDIDSNTQELYNERRNIITKTVKQVSPAVVGINVKEIRQYRSPWANDPFWQHFFGSRIYNQEVQSVGSGTIISPDGYILTNDHVAGTASEIVINLTDGRQYKAELIGSDLTTDICLLKIDGEDLPYVRFGNSDDIMIGEWAVAIGNPFGLFSMTDNPSVTVGVISALGMNLTPLEARYYMNMIQTDASINQGNSGGPLVNSVGQMIGMNTIIYTAQGSAGNVGVGFAIPINKIKKIVEELKKNGSFDRNYRTGLRIQDIDKKIADYFDLSRAKGVLVREVEGGSPGEAADIKEYDIITAINGLRVDNSEVLLGLLKEYKAEEFVTFTILRDGNKITRRMKLEKQ